MIDRQTDTPFPRLRSQPISEAHYEFLTMEGLYSGYFIAYGWVPRCAMADLHNSSRYRSMRLTRIGI